MILTSLDLLLLGGTYMLFDITSKLLLVWLVEIIFLAVVYLFFRKSKRWRWTKGILTAAGVDLVFGVCLYMYVLMGFDA